MDYELFTIGYEKKNIDEYVRLLKRSKIKILIDVRETAWSYKRDFCKTKFSEALAESGIVYVHINKAGNPKRLRKNSSSREEALSKYTQYLNQTESGISDILDVLVTAKLEGEKVCLTCYEKQPHECHRSVIADYLNRQFGGVTVHHL